MNVPFLNLAAQSSGLKAELLSAVEEVLDQAHFILGPNVQAFENEIATLTGTRFGVGVNSGSDALILALKALEIGPGDEVVTTPFTYIAPAEAIHHLGARVVFADIDPHTFCLDPSHVSKRITARTRAVLPVHLFGQTAAISELLTLCQSHGLSMVEDCAQAIGATSAGRPAGSFGVMGCFSFYPTKNLGANGDAGMVVTSDETLAKRLRMLRVHGIERRYHHELHGYNSRLDEIQAAILRVKLPRLRSWNERRASLARRYQAGLEGLPLVLPTTAQGNSHVYHVYAVLAKKRDALQRFLADRGVSTLIYYPIPLHLQNVYRDLGFKQGDFPVSESIAKRILPLPMYPELTDQQADHVITAIRQFSF